MLAAWSKIRSTMRSAGISQRELEYRIPRLHSPINSWRFPEISVRTKQASCRLSWKTYFQIELLKTGRATVCLSDSIYARLSNEDPAKSGIESKRILNVEGVFS